MLYGGEGETVKCKAGWSAAGACASGRRADCKDAVLGNKYYTNLRCCPHKFNTNPEHDCVAEHAGYGQDAYCPLVDPSLGEESYILGQDGLCTSGMHSHCGGEFTKVKCCETSDISVGPKKYCGWAWGNYGEDLVCPSDYVMAGTCSSGAYADCHKGKAYTGIYCCPFVDNRS